MIVKLRRCLLMKLIANDLEGTHKDNGFSKERLDADGIQM